MSRIEHGSRCGNKSAHAAMKAPNPNIQAPEKFQIPNFNEIAKERFTFYQSRMRLD